jgi:CheY-like chemotaxis protein
LAAVLVVEDEPLLSLDISEALKDEGYDAIPVADADEALKVLETRKDIRTIFTDVIAGFHGWTEVGRRCETSLAACEHYRHNGQTRPWPGRDARESLIYRQAISQRGSSRCCAFVRGDAIAVNLSANSDLQVSDKRGRRACVTGPCRGETD